MEKMEAKFNPDTGEVTIDFYTWFTMLSPEKRDDLYPTWRDLAYEHIKDMLLNDYATPNYDEAIHELRVELLTGDNAPDMLKSVVRAVLNEAKHAEARASDMSRAYWEMRKAWPDKHLKERPGVPSYMPHPSPTSKDVEEFIEEHSGTEAVSQEA